MENTMDLRDILTYIVNISMEKCGVKPGDEIREDMVEGILLQIGKTTYAMYDKYVIGGNRNPEERESEDEKSLPKEG